MSTLHSLLSVLSIIFRQADRSESNNCPNYNDDVCNLYQSLAHVQTNWYGGQGRPSQYVVDVDVRVRCSSNFPLQTLSTALKLKLPLSHPFLLLFFTLFPFLSEYLHPFCCWTLFFLSLCLWNSPRVQLSQFAKSMRTEFKEVTNEKFTLAVWAVTTHTAKCFSCGCFSCKATMTRQRKLNSAIA